MADLEKLLLEAAGRTSTGGRNRHSPLASRRRRDGSYSDDGSDSKDDDSDDDRAYASRKPSGSQVPLKKRLDPTEREDDRSSQEEGDDDGVYDHEGDSGDDSVGSDLYKDEADRQKLAEMTELERECPQPRKEKESPRRTSSRGVRSSARSADRAAAKDDALNELRAKRLKHQDPEAHRKLRDAARGGSGSKGFSPIKRKAFKEANLSSSSQSESGSHSEDEESTGDGGIIDSDEDKTSPDSDVPTFEDIKEITIRRVGIGKSRTGPIYRLCMVRNVDASDPDRQYKLENKTTHKYLNVIWGNESSAARWQMAMVSDSPPIKEEFDQWVREVERSGGRMPSKQDEKKSATRRPLNVAAEKDRLRREMEVSKSKNDEAEVERIKARLQELEASRQVQGKDAKALRLAEMNKRNRANGGDGEEAATAAANGDITAPTGVEGNEPSGGIMAEAGMAATAAALEAAADAGKLVDTSAPVDQGTESNMLHNFELPISLSVLQKFGGPQGAQAGFMARKQRIEATVGCRVPDNDGRRHALTLTVSDYKRRRGLL
ncbi:plus-3 domain-containing protein [Actinidia rufa]|uniref:Plus-3 domain-containing protein n=1 Tax=Actinidia rufa TaxID=165716 RepID=A0A7J0EZN0_9ERIC|nr:plus-3 domain-containing protein [Actinidia rufa]